MEQNTQLLDYIAEHEAIIQYNLCKRQVLRSVLSWIFCIIYYTKTCKIAISKNCQIRSAHPVHQRRRTPWAYAYSQGSFFVVGADPWVRPVGKTSVFHPFPANSYCLPTVRPGGRTLRSAQTRHPTVSHWKAHGLGQRKESGACLNLRRGGPLGNVTNWKDGRTALLFYSGAAQTHCRRAGQIAINLEIVLAIISKLL